MKKYRRVEITVFRKRLTIISRDCIITPSADVPATEVDAIDPGSDEGRRILADAVDLLQEKLTPHNDPNRRIVDD